MAFDAKKGISCEKNIVTFVRLRLWRVRLSRFDVVSYSLLPTNIYNLMDMYNSKLFAILQHFDKYEQNRCRKYIQSPYFNRSEELLTLYEAFLKTINSSKKNGGLDKTYLWSLLQPDKPYDDVRFRKYCSDLLKLVEGYLGQEIYEKRDLQKTVNRMEAIEKRRAKVLTPTVIREAGRHLKNYPNKSAQFYLNNYLVEKALYELKDSDIKRTERNNVEKISINLDYFYVAEKLKYYCLVLMQKSIVEEDYDIKMIDEITSSVTKYNLSRSPAIAVYFQIFLLLNDKENEDYFYELIKILKENNMEFSREEAYNMYSYAINFCIGRINQGQSKYVEECFKIFKELIDTKILFREDRLRAWDFKNIVVLALRLGNYSWAEHFINKYSEKLPLAFRQNAISYNLAQVYFYQKKHEKVIELLREVEYEDVAYNLGSKAMLLATYYETDEMEPLYSLFESFRAYLNRHKDIPVNRRKNYGNLIRFTRKLTRIMPGDQSAVDKFKKELKETKNVASLNWLKEKLAELED